MAKKKNSGSNLVEQSAYYWNGEPQFFESIEKPDLTKPLVVDLFCGLGGLSLGFKMSGFQVVLGLDIHKPSIETFRHSHKEAISILGDIRKIIELDEDTGIIKNKENLIVSSLKSAIGEHKIDVLMGGIPCQGFSLCNRKRSIHDERNYLFVYFMEVARALNPAYLLIENVSGIKSLGNGSFAEDIKEAIRELGYCVDDKLLNAADFGVPQIRKRVFFQGANKGYPILWPEPTFGKPKKPYRTVRDAIADLPILESGQSDDEYSTNDFSKLTEFQKLMRKNNKKLKNSKAANHPQETIDRIKNTKPGEPMYPRFKQRIRLDWDKPSPTQVSGGIRPQFQFGHPSQNRGLTVRERCRIQSIPDEVEIFGGLVQGRVQTGNAVPPLLSNALANVIKLGLTKENFNSKLLNWFKSNKRSFPWRERETAPYKILISEFLLRKTRADNVVQTYLKFIEKYPEPNTLLDVPEKDLETLLKPLGLSNVRAEALKKIGKILVSRFFGNVPDDESKLAELPHVGRYIANAVVCFGYNQRKPLVDENIQRILSRFFGFDLSEEIHKADYLWNAVDALMPDENFKDFLWAMLDFAASVCVPREPRCNVCPLHEDCFYWHSLREDSES